MATPVWEGVSPSDELPRPYTLMDMAYVVVVEGWGEEEEVMSCFEICSPC